MMPSPSNLAQQVRQALQEQLPAIRQRHRLETLSDPIQRTLLLEAVRACVRWTQTGSYLASGAPLILVDVDEEGVWFVYLHGVKIDITDIIDLSGGNGLC